MRRVFFLGLIHFGQTDRLSIARAITRGGQDSCCRKGQNEYLAEKKKLSCHTTKLTSAGADSSWDILYSVYGKEKKNPNKLTKKTKQNKTRETT